MTKELLKITLKLQYNDRSPICLDSVLKDGKHYRRKFGNLAELERSDDPHLDDKIEFVSVCQSLLNENEYFTMIYAREE